MPTLYANNLLTNATLNTLLGQLNIEGGASTYQFGGAMPSDWRKTDITFHKIKDDTPYWGINLSATTADYIEAGESYDI